MNQLTNRVTFDWLSPSVFEQAAFTSCLQFQIKLFFIVMPMTGWQIVCINILSVNAFYLPT